jgi:hypothetical protein
MRLRLTSSRDIVEQDAVNSYIAVDYREIALVSSKQRCDSRRLPESRSVALDRAAT